MPDETLTESPYRDIGARDDGWNPDVRPPEQLSERPTPTRERDLNGFLVEATSLLGSSLNFRETLNTLSSLAVPQIADWCSVYIVDENFRIEHHAVAHVNPAKIELARDYAASYPPDFDAADGVGGVVRTGRSMRTPRLTDEMLVYYAKDSEHLRLLRQLGLTSCLVVPLRNPKRVIGAMVLANSESDHRFTDVDESWAEELAQRAARAVENARLFGEAQALNHAKDEFLATLSHELRTPLNVILGNAEYLMETLDLENDQREALEAIYRNSQLQTRLIADLLDVSSIVTGKIRFQTQEVSPARLVAETVENMRPTAEARGVRLEIDLERSPDQLAADPTRIPQILWNLISNALKFTPPGGRVSVRSRRAGERWLIEVEDSGAGIAPDHLSSIFERFRQEDSSSTRIHGGLGLGLSIVKSLVELHGGHVHAESAGKGFGARFIVDIPIHHKPSAGGRGDLARDLPDDQTEHATKRASRTADASARRIDGVRSLLIEDSADNRLLVARFLKRAGAVVTEAESAPAGRRALAGATFDVIICDIGMPDEDGLEFIRALRAGGAAGRSTPAIALTAYARPEEKQACLDAGFQTHVAKPFGPGELVSEIGRLLARSPNSQPNSRLDRPSDPQSDPQKDRQSDAPPDSHRDLI